MITSIQPAGNSRFGHIGNAASAPVKAGRTLPLFGDSHYPRVEPVDAATISQRKLLLPPNTPMFLLHGLSSDGNYLVNLEEYVKSVEADWPLYVSFIPEAHDGEPIENPRDPSDIPSARLALHDIGSFRYQYIRNNLAQLVGVAGEIQGKPDEVQKKRLAEYFEVLPEYAEEIVPLIQEFILFPIFQLPAEMKQRGFTRNLLFMTNNETRKLTEEVQKFKNPKDFPATDIIDTNTLYFHAKKEGKEINLDPYTQFKGDETINLRPIPFREITELETYLMQMEERLTQALTPVMDNDTERARKTTAKLMEKIAPQGLALGYSQGGAILQAALMAYLDEGPKNSGQLDKQGAKPELLAARYIGMGTYFSSPMRGSPRRPHFAEKLMEEINTIMSERTILRRLTGGLESFLDWFVWRQKIKKKPSLAEMLEGGSLSKRTLAFFNHDTSMGPSTIDDFNGTLVTAADSGDSYVNPESSKLTDEKGDTAVNVFNIDVEAFDLPPDNPHYAYTPLELFREAFPFLDEKKLKAISRLPEKYLQFFFEHFGPIYNSAVRHSGLLYNTDKVFNDIGRKILGNTRSQINLLDTRNFEPLRYQSLIPRMKVYQREILSKEPAEALAHLGTFMTDYPAFIHALIDNAAEALPVKSSASFLATRMLDDTLTLIEKSMDTDAPRGKKSLTEIYEQPLRATLNIIAWANLEPYGTSEGINPEGLSKRAEHLLDRLPPEKPLVEG